MAEQNPDELVISANEQLQKCIQDAIDQYLVGKQYNQKQVPHWINDICQDVIKKLVALQKPYKYAVNCTIMQKNGAGSVLAHNYLWDSASDVSATIVWPNKQTKAQMLKIYALSLIPS